MHSTQPGLPTPDWSRILEALDGRDRFLVTTHQNPDGDGLGAELGLWWYLKSRGKDARIVNPDPLSDRYAFLGREGEYEAYDPVRHNPVIAGREAVIVLDISRWERLGALGETLRASNALKICIDHHPFENNGMADLYAVDLTAAATGQLVYEMIRDRGHAVDRRMALGFYVSILTDTGSFRFTNSDARAHRAAGELLAAGLDPNELYEEVYGNSSLARLRLLGEGLSTMRVEAEGRIAMLVLDRKMIEASGAVPADTEGFVDVARTLSGTEGIVLLFERADGQVKVSLRSRGLMNVNRVAAVFGGGGHVLASGATHPGPLARAERELLAAMVDALPPEGDAAR